MQYRTKARRAVSQSNRKYQCGTRKRQVEGLITNGSNTKVGEWPWHGALFHRKNRRSREYKCGATLIHQNFVITASHCVVDRDSGYEVNAGYVTVDFGYVQLFSPSSHGQSHTVQEIFVHPQFAKDSNKHDVAILSLKTAVIFSDYVLPICLALTRFETSIHDIVGKQGVVVGWGLTEDDETSTDLKMANLPVVDYAECLETDRDLFGSLIYPGMFCAGSRNGTNVCNGDSGGGMFFSNGRRWILRGITSFSGTREDGSNKCDVNNYAGFVNVQYYASWIHQTVQEVDDAFNGLATATPKPDLTRVSTERDTPCGYDDLLNGLTTVTPQPYPSRESTRRVSACKPNPCGRNADCREDVNSRAVCSCALGYDGDPLVACTRNECLDDVECSKNYECQQGRCVDVCSGPCGINAICTVRNGIPVCSCPKNMNGDPFVRCLAIRY
ncbi:serine protease 27-like [Aedes albopictus]|uniref:Trypsin-like serine protease n=1 Tax=Aedes albopictus TaxID=7160 RepID=A0ABM1ZAV7_AEDAL